MSPAAPTSDMQILQRIGSTARAFAALTRRSITSPSCPASSSPLPSVLTPLTFPPPQNISSALVSLGLHLPIAEKISNAYQRTSTEYRAHALTQCKRTLPSLGRDDPRGRLYVERLIAQYVSTMVVNYLKVLQGWQEGILETVSTRIRIIRESRQPDHVLDKRPFNQVLSTYRSTSTRLMLFRLPSLLSRSISTTILGHHVVRNTALQKRQKWITSKLQYGYALYLILPASANDEA